MKRLIFCSLLVLAVASVLPAQKKSGYQHVPVYSLALSERAFEQEEGFRL